MYRDLKELNEKEPKKKDINSEFILSRSD